MIWDIFGLEGFIFKFEVQLQIQQQESQIIHHIQEHHQVIYEEFPHAKCQQYLDHIKDNQTEYFIGMVLYYITMDKALNNFAAGISQDLQQESFPTFFSRSQQNRRGIGVEPIDHHIECTGIEDNRKQNADTKCHIEFIKEVETVEG